MQNSDRSCVLFKGLIREMRNRHKTRSTILATIAILILMAWIWDLTAAARGTLEARFDLARGHYAILAYGLPPGGRDEYTRLLKERYGIERHQIALCIVGPSTIAYADSYNHLSVPAAQSRFGHDVFEQTWQDAQRTWLHQWFPRERIASYLFPDVGKTADTHHDPVCLHLVKPGMPMTEIVERCGRPEEDRGSDKYQFVYRMPDGALVKITARSLLNIEQVTYQAHQNHAN